MHGRLPVFAGNVEVDGKRSARRHERQKTDRQDAQHILRLLNMISADLGSELGEPDCPDFSASHSIDGQVDEASVRNLTRWNSLRYHGHVNYRGHVNTQ